MAEKKEKSVEKESDKQNTWDISDTNEQRKHNMWGSLSQALADIFKE